MLIINNPVFRCSYMYMIQIKTILLHTDHVTISLAWSLGIQKKQPSRSIAAMNNDKDLIELVLCTTLTLMWTLNIIASPINCPCFLWHLFYMFNIMQSFAWFQHHTVHSCIFNTINQIKRKVGRTRKESSKEKAQNWLHLGSFCCFKVLKPLISGVAVLP